MAELIDSSMSRRSYLKRMAALAGLALGAGALVACGRRGGGGAAAQSSAATASSTASASQTGLSCTDISGLTSSEKDLRQNVSYVDHSPLPSKRCDDCIHFVAGTKSNTCGTCHVVPGPINPKGFCTLWTGM